MKKVIAVCETKMNELPNSCVDCTFYGCTLPCCARDNTKIKKTYFNKRHKDCPLKLQEG